MKLSIDYKAIFKDRVIIITGVGRSGTSILGKLLGSMQPSHYLYEPAILKLMTWEDAGEELRAILFEDYFLPLVQGRNINWNASDDSFIGNYLLRPLDKITTKWSVFSSRPNAIKYLQDQGLFIIKMTEFPLWQLPEDTFPGAIEISIIRNGNDVISSSIAHGWFMDDYQPIDHVTGSGAPWFADYVGWSKWNPYTRAACVWRSCIEEARAQQADPGIELRYEDLIERPEHWVTYFDKWLACKRTELTNKHVADIKAFVPKVYSSILGEIQEPEKEKFMSLMSELGYKP